MNVREFFGKVYSWFGVVAVLATMIILGYSLNIVHRNMYKHLVDATSVPTASTFLFLWSTVVLKKLNALVKYMSKRSNMQNNRQVQEQQQQSN